MIYAGSRRGTRLDGQYLNEEYFQNTVMAWDGTTWTVLRDEEDGLIGDVLSHGGDLYVGLSIGGEDNGRPSVVVYDGDGWRPVGGPFASKDSYPARVGALAWHDGRLVAGGRFVANGGNRMVDAAYWDDVAWRAIGDGVEGMGVHRLLASGGSLWCSRRLHDHGRRSSLVRWDGGLPIHEPPTPHEAAARPAPQEFQPVDFVNGNFSAWEDGLPVGWMRMNFTMPGAERDHERPPLKDAVSPLGGGGIVLRSGGVEAFESVLDQSFTVDAEKLTRFRIVARRSAPENDPDWAAVVSVGKRWEQIMIDSQEFVEYGATLSIGRRRDQGRVRFNCLGDEGRLEVRSVEVVVEDLSFIDPFELLVSDMTANCPYFATCPVAWDSLVTAYRPIVASAVNIDAFKNILATMLEKLCDAEMPLTSRVLSDVISTTRVYRPPEPINGADTGVNVPWLKERLSSIELLRHCVTGRLEDGIGYVVLESAGFDTLETESAVAILRLTVAPVLMIDLRMMGKRRMDRRPPDSQRRWVKAFFDEITEASTPDLPIVCLIGPGCKGVGVELAGLLRTLPNAVFVGAATGRPTSEMKTLKLAHGTAADYPVRRLESGGIDGRRVDPDHIVPPAPGIDSVAQKAMELIRAR